MASLISLNHYKKIFLRLWTYYSLMSFLLLKEKNKEKNKKIKNLKLNIICLRFTIQLHFAVIDQCVL